MGMSTHIIGIMPADDAFNKMKAAWDACEAVGANIPDAVLEFFGGERPQADGATVELKKRQWQNDHQEGIEIDIADLPPGVKTIRFYNSW